MFLFLKSFRYNRVLKKFLECLKNVSFHPCCWSEKETHEKSFPDEATGSDLYLIIAEPGSSELRDLSLHIHKDVDKRNVAPKIKAILGLLIFSRHNVFTHVPSHTHNYSMENTFFKKTQLVQITSFHLHASHIDSQREQQLCTTTDPELLHRDKPR